MRIMEVVQTLSPTTSGDVAWSPERSEDASSKGGVIPSTKAGVLRTTLFPKGLLHSVAIMNMTMKTIAKK